MSGGQTGFGAPRPPSLTPVRSVSNPDERWSRSIVKKKSIFVTEDAFENMFFGQTGFEPATSTSRTSRATSCAIARNKQIKKGWYKSQLRPQCSEPDNGRTVKKNCESLE